MRTTPESLQFPVKSKVKSLIFSLSESAHLTFTPLTGHAHCPWPRPAKTGACAYCCMTHVKWMVPVYTELPFLHSSCTVCMFLSAAKQLKCHFSVHRRCHTETHAIVSVCVRTCVCDCRFWLLAGSRSTTDHTSCSRTGTASSTRWSSRQAEPRPPRCCTQPNR